MGTLWHYSGQQKKNRPIDSDELRQLAAEGKIGQRDLVRRSGSRRWIPAAKVEGLFGNNQPEWYYTRNGRHFGPVAFRQLWKEARAGSLQPDDRVWKVGMARWKRAAKIVGMFPGRQSSPRPKDPAGHRADGHPVSGPTDMPGPAEEVFPWEFATAAYARIRSDVLSETSATGQADPDFVGPRTLGRTRWLGRRRPIESRRKVQESDRDPVASTVEGHLPWDRVLRFLRLFAFNVPVTVPVLVVIMMIVIVGGFLLNRGSSSVPAATTGVTPKTPAGRSDALGRPNQVARIRPSRPQLPPPLGPRNGPGPEAPKEDEDHAPSRSQPVGGSSVINPEFVELRPEDERRVGLEIHELIVARHKVLGSGGESLRQRISEAAAPLIAKRQRLAPPLTFTVLDSERVFTFSHPGGYLYVSRSLFDFVRNDVELQFVLGVEIAHLDLRHLEHEAKRLAREDAARGGAPLGPARRLYRQIAVGYTEDQVFEADAWSFRSLRRLGQPWYKSFTWLSPLYDFHGEDDPRGARRIPDTDLSADRQEVEGHWLTLPPAAERYNRLRSLVVTTNS